MAGRSITVFLIQCTGGEYEDLGRVKLTGIVHMCITTIQPIAYFAHIGGFRHEHPPSFLMVFPCLYQKSKLRRLAEEEIDSPSKDGCFVFGPDRP